MKQFQLNSNNSTQALHSSTFTGNGGEDRKWRKCLSCAFSPAPLKCSQSCAGNSLNSCLLNLLL